MRRLSTVYLLCFMLPVGSSVKADMFKDLEADNFKVREQAQADLELWARERKGESIMPLLKQYRDAKSPEVQARLEAVLKEQVILKRFGSGPGFVGIQMQDGEVKLDGEGVPAVGITSIVDDSAAEKAGLAVGDQVIAVDKVRFGDDNLGRVAPSLVFSNYVRTKTANDVVTLKIVRNGKLLEKKVTLMAMPEKVRIQQLELRLPDAGVSQEEKERYFQRWLLNELQK